MAKTLAPIASLFLGIAFLLCGNGLQTTLTPLRAEYEGFSAIEIGLMGSGYYAGFVLGCLAGPYLILQAGHIRAFAALVAIASAAALLHPIAIDPIAWVLARAATGFSLAGIYLIVESWLNDRATNENRGLVMSSYIIVNFVMITVGQLLVLTAPIEAFTLFAVASILVSVATIPVALTRSAQPAPIALVQFRPLKLYRMAPVGIMGTFLIGIANGAFWSLGTLYATSQGLDTNGAAIFMSVAVIGGAVMQWPIGRVSDLFDRRLVLAVAMGVAALVSLLLALLPLGGVWLAAMALAFGMTTLTGYSIAAAHAYDRADRSTYVEMATGVLLANGLGSIIGPIVASWLVARYGASWLFISIAVTQVVLIAFIVARTVMRPATADEHKESFDVYSTAPVGGVITPEPIDESDPNMQTPAGLVGPATALDADNDEKPADAA